LHALTFSAINFPLPLRYILSGQVADFTGFIYFSCFNEIGHLLLGQTADEMESLKMQDEAAYDRAIAEPLGTTWNLFIRAKSDMWQDQQKIRYNVIRAVP
jgi:replication factor A1